MANNTKILVRVGGILHSAQHFITDSRTTRIYCVYSEVTIFMMILRGTLNKINLFTQDSDNISGFKSQYIV